MHKPQHFFSLNNATFMNWSTLRARALGLALCAVMPFFLGAQTSPRISIQGTLKDANGTAVADGNYTVTFRLYNQETGGTHLWQEEATVEVVGGIYSHYLGSVQALDAANFANTLYLGIRIGSFELTPRTELTYAPYTFSANTAQKVLCSGAVGDVKYSILNPTQFAAQNGSCWVPMDGRTLASTDLLRALYGITTLPDAGGLFIRSQEFAGGANNDPNRTSSSPIATVQTDATRAHNHSVSLSGTTSTSGSHTHSLDQITLQRMSGDSDGGSNRFDQGSGDVRQNITVPPSNTTGSAGSHTHTISLSGTTDNNTGSETRPANINLWVYIRIN
jgi:hypothetical protein